MSYILEALKKAEQQRELGQIPGIASNHDSAAGRSARRWLWPVVVLVNAAILGSLLLLWFSTDSETVAENAPVVKSDQPRPAPVAVAPAPRVVPIEAPPGSPAYADPLPRRPDFGMVGVDAIADPGRPEQKPADKVMPVVEQLPRQASLPVWPRIPDYLFAQLSDGLRLDVHVYSDQAESRFVLINLQKYREGDKLPGGPVLDEITSEGVILSLSGERFRLQAQ